MVTRIWIEERDGEPGHWWVTKFKNKYDIVPELDHVEVLKVPKEVVDYITEGNLINTEFGMYAWDTKIMRMVGDSSLFQVINYFELDSLPKYIKQTYIDSLEQTLKYLKGK